MLSFLCLAKIDCATLTVSRPLLEIPCVLRKIKTKVLSLKNNLEAPAYNICRAKQWTSGPQLYIFWKNVSTSLHLAWILFFLCAYFYIILTQGEAITYLVCKHWSKELLHTLLCKNIWELIKVGHGPWPMLAHFTLLLIWVDLGCQPQT